MGNIMGQKLSVMTDKVRNEGDELFESAQRIDKVYDKLVNRNSHLSNRNTIAAQGRLTEVISDIEYYMPKSMDCLNKVNCEIMLFTNRADKITLMASEGVVNTGGGIRG